MNPGGQGGRIQLGCLPTVGGGHTCGFSVTSSQLGYTPFDPGGQIPVSNEIDGFGYS